MDIRLQQSEQNAADIRAVCLSSGMYGSPVSYEAYESLRRERDRLRSDYLGLQSSYASLREEFGIYRDQAGILRGQLDMEKQSKHAALVEQQRSIEAAYVNFQQKYQEVDLLKSQMEALHQQVEDLERQKLRFYIHF